MSDPNKNRPEKAAGLQDADRAAGFQDDVEGHRVAAADGPEDIEGHRVAAVDGPDDDTEGHRKIDRRADFQSDPERNRPGLLEEDDVEGHRFKAGHVQPPRDADLGNTEH